MEVNNAGKLKHDNCPIKTLVDKCALSWIWANALDFESSNIGAKFKSFATKCVETEKQKQLNQPNLRYLLKLWKAFCLDPLYGVWTGFRGCNLKLDIFGLLGRQEGIILQEKPRSLNSGIV